MKILIVGTNMMNIYHHRLELIKALISKGYEMTVAAPEGKEVEKLLETGCKFINLEVDNRGTSIKNDLKLLYRLRKLYKREKPDVILTFYTKTNIYGGLVARAMGIPYIENITGLGSSLAKGEGRIYRIMSMLYRMAVRNARIIFFQNKSNLKFFHDRKLYKGPYRMLPGSGVSLERYVVLPYAESPKTEFLYLSRILKEKGIKEYVDAARIIKKSHKDVVFHVAGPCDPSCQKIIEEAVEEGVITYHGKIYDIPAMFSQIHCTVHPSYYPEGMANVLLESAASGRPVITTGLPGCGETVNHGETGFVVRERSAEDLAAKMENFIKMDRDSRIAMGIAGRKKMEQEFDRRIVTEAYLEEISKIVAS